MHKSAVVNLPRKKVPKWDYSRHKERKDDLDLWIQKVKHSKLSLDAVAASCCMIIELWAWNSMAHGHKTNFSPLCWLSTYLRYICISLCSLLGKSTWICRYQRTAYIKETLLTLLWATKQQNFELMKTNILFLLIQIVFLQIAGMLNSSQWQQAFALVAS